MIKMLIELNYIPSINKEYEKACKYIKFTALLYNIIATVH